MTEQEAESTRAVFGAVDIGASSGRVMAAIVGPATDADVGPAVELIEVHRFTNRPVSFRGGLHWDFAEIWEQVVRGLRELVRRWPEVTSVGIDTWAVDYGLLDADGDLLGNPFCYRDSRTGGVIDQVHGRVSQQRLYEISGLQFLPFNTIYQLASEDPVRLQQAAALVLMPDLIAQGLTGVAMAEVTNASTTGLLDAQSRTWSPELIAALGLPAEVLPSLVEPGETIGKIQPGLGLPAIPVVAVGSHDTASAVVGVPASDRPWAYISSGTWSLVGVELDAPVLTPESQQANFTNEGGVDGTIRYLRNVGGLWLWEQCREEWGDAAAELTELLAAASELSAGGPTFDVDDPSFIAPGDMVQRIRAAVAGTGSELADDPVAVTRCIMDSLAHCYAQTLAQASELSGRPVDVVHIVGGGSQNALLCQLTANATGLEVVAGPVEATALGNVAIQARAAGIWPQSLTALRSAIRQSVDLQRYHPH